MHLPARLVGRGVLAWPTSLPCTIPPPRTGSSFLPDARLAQTCSIGITQRFDDSIDLFCKRLGWPQPGLSLSLSRNVAENRPKQQIVRATCFCSGSSIVPTTLSLIRVPGFFEIAELGGW